MFQQYGGVCQTAENGSVCVRHEPGLPVNSVTTHKADGVPYSLPNAWNWKPDSS